MIHSNHLSIFLCGDVMTGRGIDQVLPHPGDPRIYESWIKDSRSYRDLAQKTNGPIPAPVSFDYIWGAALDELQQRRPHIRIVNLETAITTSMKYWPGKGINYKMHPGNTPCLTTAGIDACALANNHVLDWEYEGLADTLDSLHSAQIKTAGAGANINDALAPAIIPIPKSENHVLLFSCGFMSSGILSQWAATDNRAGIVLMDESTRLKPDHLRAWVNRYRKPGDYTIFSIHRGGNWGYEIPQSHRDFAHMLIDEVEVDIVHGHSSHHPRAIEMHEGKPIFYGCGDFINDYEGISGYEKYRDDLRAMYFVTIDTDTRTITQLDIIPLQACRFSLRRPKPEDTTFMTTLFARKEKKFGCDVRMNDNAGISLLWK
ncbi:MAG: poly-gamma-glutamate biosynthesis protein [Chitinivibrionales bacterium]|nr:poly-gamma-glutamate biosynthesis protein [Chitinivibrionales bacterium]